MKYHVEDYVAGLLQSQRFPTPVGVTPINGLEDCPAAAMGMIWVVTLSHYFNGTLNVFTHDAAFFIDRYVIRDALHNLVGSAYSFKWYFQPSSFPLLDEGVDGGHSSMTPMWLLKAFNSARPLMDFIRSNDGDAGVAYYTRSGGYPEYGFFIRPIHVIESLRLMLSDFVIPRLLNVAFHPVSYWIHAAAVIFGYKYLVKTAVKQDEAGLPLPGLMLPVKLQQGDLAGVLYAALIPKKPTKGGALTEKVILRSLAEGVFKTSVVDLAQRMTASFVNHPFLYLFSKPACRGSELLPVPVNVSPIGVMVIGSLLEGLSIISEVPDWLLNALPEGVKQPVPVPIIDDS